MDSKIVLNDYIKADIVADILSQNIVVARKRVLNEQSEDAQKLLEKLLEYNREVQKGNVKVMDKILKGEI